jgi:hypothetical protein
MSQETDQVLKSTYDEIAHVNKMLKQAAKVKNQPLQSQLHELLIEELKSKHEFINTVLNTDAERG